MAGGPSAAISAPASTSSRPRGHCFTSGSQSSNKQAPGQASSSALLGVTNNRGGHFVQNSVMNSGPAAKQEREQFYKFGLSASRGSSSPYQQMKVQQSQKQ